MSPVPFRDFPRSVNAHGAGWQQRLVSAIERYDFMRPNGHLENFEQAFAEYCGSPYCVATSSGTSALLLAYMAIGLSHGDEIITTANTFTATVEAARHLGAKPRFVDIEPDSYAIDPALIARAINANTKAIVPFHPFGRICNMDALQKLAKDHKLYLIEEACQAHGATYKGQKAGSFGDLAVFSFGASKPLAGLGEGGAVTTNNQKLWEHMKLLNNHGRKGAYHVLIGLNFRMHPVEAAYLLDRLDYFPEMIEERREIARAYNVAFCDLGIVKNPLVELADSHSYYIYVIEVPKRESFLERLSDRNIAWGIHYPIAIHQQRAQQDLEPVSLPVTEALQERMVSLPMINGLTREEIEAVIAAVEQSV